MSTDAFEALAVELDAATDELVVPPPENPMGVARQFLQCNFGDHRAARLVHHRGLFYGWHDTHWREREQRAVRAYLYTWLESALYLKKGKLVPFEPTRGKVANVVEALEAVAHVSEHVEPPTWVAGQPPWPAGDTIAMQNGLLRLSTRDLHPHTPEFFNVHVLPFAFDPAASAPKLWERFLRDLWADDEESIATLGEMMGYILAGGTGQQKMFMLVGPKRTGKGTILRVLTALLGPENVAAPTLSSLATNFGLQPLVGKPLAAISDARLGNRSDVLVAVERLLSISGEDAITIDRKYRDPWTGRLPTRFVLLTNEIPRFTDASGALASRFLILTLANSFYGREDTTLTDRLLAEAPGIFNWCVACLDRLVARGRFEQPSTASSALRHLEDLASPVSAFVRDRCEIDPQCMVDKDELWQAWREWCTDEGAHPGTKSVFTRDLRAAVPGAVPRRPGSGVDRRHVIAGLTLSEKTVANTPDVADSNADTGAASGTSGVLNSVFPTEQLFDADRARRFDEMYRRAR
jgi:putative DNA primase/helicase